MKNKSASLPDLEKSLEEITQLIGKMEEGKLSLEQSLQCFERGVCLIKHSQKILATASSKVQILMQNNEEKLTDFEIAENEPA